MHWLTVHRSQRLPRRLVPTYKVPSPQQAVRYLRCEDATSIRDAHSINSSGFCVSVTSTALTDMILLGPEPVVLVPKLDQTSTAFETRLSHRHHRCPVHR